MQTGTQHFVFAHTALPRLFLANPGLFLETVAKPGSPALRSIWTQCTPRPSAAEGIAVDWPIPTLTSINGHRAVIIQLPKPRADGDAYYVVAVLQVTGCLMFKQVEPRIFILDRHDRHSSETAFAERDSDGRFISVPGCEPEVTALVTTIGESLRQSREVTTRAARRVSLPRASLIRG